VHHDYDITSLFKTAYSSAASLQKGERGFRSTGIYHLNRNAIPEYRHAASLTTDCDASVVDEAVDRSGQKNRHWPKLWFTTTSYSTRPILAKN